MDICAHFQHTSMNHVYLMIGGNIGNRLDNLENARNSIKPPIEKTTIASNAAKNELKKLFIKKIECEEI